MISSPRELPGRLEAFPLPGGLYAAIPHFGPPEAIEPSWDRWPADWLASSGWELDPSRPQLEWYQTPGSLVCVELSVTLLCDPMRRRLPAA